MNAKRENVEGLANYKTVTQKESLGFGMKDKMKRVSDLAIIAVVLSGVVWFNFRYLFGYTIEYTLWCGIAFVLVSWLLYLYAVFGESREKGDDTEHEEYPITKIELKSCCG
ncbi:hypothetical protein VNN41_09880 [Lactococcus garvieae]|uniref:hypothetical protein n=1 Tax=Lactococcus garvieae TaxID=1363 RepID=UPI0032482422